MVNNEPHGWKITPGTSTVAKFKTLILNLLDSTRQEQSVK